MAYYISGLIPYDGIIGLILSGISAVCIFMVIVLAFYGRSDSFKGLIRRFIKKGGEK